MTTIHVTTTNRVAELTSPYSIVQQELEDEWSFQVPNFQFMKHKFVRFNPQTQEYEQFWNGRKKFLSRDRLPAGLFWATKQQIEKDYDIRFVVRRRHDRPDFLSRQTEDSDREFQNNCMDAMVAGIAYGGGLILNATGTGKTRIAGMFAGTVAGSICFVVDQLDLLEQAKAELERTLGKKVGYVGNLRYEPRRVTVATVQTLYKHVEDDRFQDWFQSLDYVLIDELHVQMARSQFKVIQTIEPKAVFGLTATLQLSRKDVRTRAFAICGPILYTYPLSQGVAEEYLSQGVAVALRYENDVSYQERKEYWVNQYVTAIQDNGERNSMIADLARVGHSRGKYTIILVNRIKHLQDLSTRLKDIPHRLVYGAKKVTDRIRSKEKFEKGRVRLIITNQVFKKGVDIKRVDMGIDAAAMQSKNDAVQKYGRLARLHPEKSGFLYFDISDVDNRPQRRKQRDGKWKKKPHAFHNAGVSRLQALRKAGIPVLKIGMPETLLADEILDKAEKFLALAKKQPKTVVKQSKHEAAVQLRLFPTGHSM